MVDFGNKRAPHPPLPPDPAFRIGLLKSDKGSLISDNPLLIRVAPTNRIFISEPSILRISPYAASPTPPP